MPAAALFVHRLVSLGVRVRTGKLVAYAQSSADERLAEGFGRLQRYFHKC